MSAKNTCAILNFVNHRSFFTEFCPYHNIWDADCSKRCYNYYI